MPPLGSAAVMSRHRIAFMPKGHIITHLTAKQFIPIASSLATQATGEENPVYRKEDAMVLKAFKLAVILGCILVLASGCSRRMFIAGAAATGVGVGTYSYVKGNLRRTYEAPMDKVWEATLTTLQEFNLTIVSQRHDGFSGLIERKMADGRRFNINVIRQDANNTEVGIRVGTFGDRGRAEVMHGHIYSLL